MILSGSLDALESSIIFADAPNLQLQTIHGSTFGSLPQPLKCPFLKGPFLADESIRLVAEATKFLKLAENTIYESWQCRNTKRCRRRREYDKFQIFTQPRLHPATVSNLIPGIPHTEIQSTTSNNQTFHNRKRLRSSKGRSLRKDSISIESVNSSTGREHNCD